jgi:exopolysaccharide production protein ExoZ
MIPPQPGTIANIQVLRGVAVLMILPYHLQPMLTPLGIAQERFEFLSAGVHIFFVISGFIMAHIAEMKQPSARAFMVDRIIRIVPLYWLLTLVVFVLVKTGAFAWTATAGDLGASLLFVPYSSQPSLKPVLHVGWTLNLEMYFYAVFALSLAFGRWLVLLLAVPVGAEAAFGIGLPWSFYGQTIVLEFLVGMAIAKARPRLGLAPAITVGIVALVLIVLDPFHSVLEESLIRFGLPSAMLVVSALSLEARRWRFAAAPLMTLGAISYVLYLTHPLVISAFNIVQRRIGWLQQPPGAIALALATVAAALVFALVVHRRVEQPLSVLLKRAAGVTRARQPDFT